MEVSFLRLSSRGLDKKNSEEKNMVAFMKDTLMDLMQQQRETGAMNISRTQLIQIYEIVMIL